jgi:glycerol-3-phosphate O-acyltransferase/dihydroxyacetone phosphate acyltransferase
VEETNGTSTPKSDNTISLPPTSAASTQEELFRDTSLALSQGEVIGVFPEGTSYTLPSIAQVLPGAAWAAVEFVRSIRREKLEKMTTERERLVYLRGVGRDGEKTGLKIIPVGIVYEDKRKFMSRVSSLLISAVGLGVNQVCFNLRIDLCWVRLICGTVTCRKLMKLH